MGHNQHTKGNIGLGRSAKIVPVRMTPVLLAEVDELARRLGVSRSRAIRLACAYVNERTIRDELAYGDAQE